MTKSNFHIRTIDSRHSTSRGFTLIELLVATALFLILASAAVSLTKLSIGASISQQAQSGLNLNIRNAAAQIQTDLMNAGTGYFPTYNIPGAPLGITISNVKTEFDQLTILSFDPTMVAHPTVSGDTTTGTMNVTPVGITAAALAAGYHSGDILIMFSNTVSASSGMPYITTFPLTAAGSQSGSTVNITYTANRVPVAPTPPPPATPTSAGNGTWTPTATYPTDPTGISTNYGYSDPITDPDTGITTYYPYLSANSPPYDNTDWVLKTVTIVYKVDSSLNLHRCTGAAVSTCGTGSTSANDQVIASNIMGFRVGALKYSPNSTEYYTYLSSPTDTTSIPDPRQIRSVRVSLIGRTDYDVTNPFRNSYDGGPYKVEGMSFIVNPRNLSLHD